MSIADLRKEYSRAGLARRDLEADPLAQFDKWFGQAAATRGGSWLPKVAIALFKTLQIALGSPPVDCNAMVLATVDKDGRPSARTVLLKGADKRGFVFYTNYESRKGHELTHNPRAALVFYWPELERQVCVAGDVTRLSHDESEAYFKTRPKGSRLAAWASNQSDVLPDRAALESRWQEMATRFSDDDVPLPPNWGGYVLAPTRIEFWQGRPSRLHDRFSYTKQPDGLWKIERLAP